MSKITVGDLKKAIADLPDEMVVMVDGYEGGVDSPKELKTVDVYLRGYQSEYMGDHELVDTGKQRKDTFTVFYLES